MSTPCTPPLWADVSAAFLTFVLFALTAVTSLVLIRSAMGKYRYGWGGKLLRGKRSKRSPLGEPEAGKPGYEYYKLKKPHWMPSSMALLIIWVIAYIFSGYAFWRLFHGTCGFDSLYTSIATVLLVVGLAMQLLWSYTWYSMRHALAGILCTVATIAIAIALLVIYAQTAVAGTITWTAFVVQLIYTLWLLVALALQVHIRTLNHKSLFFPVKHRHQRGSYHSDDENTTGGTYYVTVDNEPASSLNRF